MIHLGLLYVMTTIYMSDCHDKKHVYSFSHRPFLKEKLPNLNILSNFVKEIRRNPPFSNLSRF